MNPIDNSTLAIPAINEQPIQDKIYPIRGLQVILDRDLAVIYGVDTKRINEAVKNNEDKFQEDFYFELTDDEFAVLRSKISTANFSKTRINPKVFTEQGVYMLATILKSKTASQTTVLIIKTFASMRKFLLSNASIFQRLENVEKRQIGFEIKSDEKFNKIFDAIEEKDVPRKQHIFFDGQIFDAYLFVSDLIKTAKSSIILFVTQVLFISLINIKEYCSYTVANTPFPPLNNVPKRGSSF